MPRGSVTSVRRRRARVTRIVGSARRVTVADGLRRRRMWATSKFDDTSMWVSDSVDKENASSEIMPVTAKVLAATRASPCLQYSYNELNM